LLLQFGIVSVDAVDSVQRFPIRYSWLFFFSRVDVLIYLGGGTVRECFDDRLILKSPILLLSSSTFGSVLAALLLFSFS